MDTIEKCMFNLMICMWIAMIFAWFGTIVYAMVIVGKGEQGKINRTI